LEPEISHTAVSQATSSIEQLMSATWKFDLLVCAFSTITRLPLKELVPQIASYATSIRIAWKIVFLGNSPVGASITDNKIKSDDTSFNLMAIKSCCDYS
jgi:hypothetical protein